MRKVSVHACVHTWMCAGVPRACPRSTPARGTGSVCPVCHCRAGHWQVTSAGARKSDSRCSQSAVLEFQFHRLTIISSLLLVPH